MIELFRTSAPMSGGIRMPPTWGYIQRNIKTNFDKVTQYYQENPIQLRTDHFLAKIVAQYPCNLANNITAFYQEVDKAALSHAQNLGMTTIVSPGKIRSGGFFGYNNPEIIIASDEMIDAEPMANTWKKAQAVQVLSHGCEDLQMALPTPHYYWTRPTQVTVILVNLPMLMVQYYYFYRENLKRPEGARWSISQFIAAYVLPNTLQSVLERALFNRLKRLSGYMPLEQSGLSRKPHPFALLNFDKAIDSALLMVLENISLANLGFDTVLKTIPAFTKKHMYEALIMPDMAPMRQIDWALTAARLPDMDWLFYITGNELKQKNQRIINDFFVDLNRNDCYELMVRNLPQAASSITRIQVQSMLERADRKEL